MTEPIQVYDGGIMPPDPVIELWQKAQQTWLTTAKDFEGSANQIAKAVKEATLSTAEFNKSVQRLADMTGFKP